MKTVPLLQLDEVQEDKPMRFGDGEVVDATLDLRVPWQAVFA